jgi:hypothetical protein
VELPDKVFENENFFSATAYEMNQGVDIEGRRREVILEEVEVEKRDSCKSAGFCRRTNFEGKVVTGFHSNCPGKKDVLYLRTDFKEVFEIKISLPKLSGGKELGVFTGEASPKVRYKEIKDLTACR